jgi:hypothetical protein
MKVPSIVGSIPTRMPWWAQFPPRPNNASVVGSPLTVMGSNPISGGVRYSRTSLFFSFVFYIED